ncbi:MAG TPA: hypothetical protein VFD58_01145 [Blastocatellia bacterium]|nr:hypothetical protein [Blastocatellia bacterium]
MRRFSLTLGLVCALAIATQAQTAQTSSSSQAQGSAQSGKVKTSADAKQDANANVRRDGRKTEASANSKSQGNASAEAGQQSLNLDAGTQINAILGSTLDSNRTQDGQQFLLKTTKDVKAGGRTVVKKGSTLIGHVANAQSKAEGGGTSALTLVIDGVEQGGQTMPLQAIFTGMIQQTAQSTLDSEMSAPISAPSAPRQSSGGGGLLGGGGVVGGVTGTLDGAVNTTTRTVGSVTGGAAGTNAGGTLSNTVNSTVSTAGGVTGQPGQVLFSLSNGVTAVTSGSASGATEFTRTGKDLKLEKGTEFILAVTGSSQTSAAAGRK